MGPLHLADYIGLDTCLSILIGWRKDYPDETAFIIPGTIVFLYEHICFAYLYFLGNFNQLFST